MSADEVQRSFAGASAKGYAKPFGRQKSLMTLCVAIFRVLPSSRFVVEGTARTLVKKRVSLSFANGAPMYIMRSRFSFAGFSTNSGGVIIKSADFLLSGVITHD